MLFCKLIEFMHVSIPCILLRTIFCVSLAPRLHPTESSLAHYCVLQLVFNNIHKNYSESLQLLQKKILFVIGHIT